MSESRRRLCGVDKRTPSYESVRWLHLVRCRTNPEGLFARPKDVHR
jgi:hypothetical protein